MEDKMVDMVAARIRSAKNEADISSCANDIRPFHDENRLWLISLLKNRAKEIGVEIGDLLDDY